MICGAEKIGVLVKVGASAERRCGNPHAYYSMHGTFLPTKERTFYAPKSHGTHATNSNSDCRPDALCCRLLTFPSIQAPPEAHAATCDSVLSQVVLQNINGQAIANAGATVAMIPQNRDGNTGDITEKPVGSGTTDATGHVQATFTAPTMLPSVYADSDDRGYVNYELMLTDKDGNILSLLYFWRWYPGLANGQAPNTGTCNGLPYNGGNPSACIGSDTNTPTSVSFAAASPLTLTANTTSTDGGVSPTGGPGPAPYWVTESTATQADVAGELHTVPDLSGNFKYGSTADSNIGVEFSQDAGAHWQVNGSFHLGNTEGQSIEHPNPTAKWGRQITIPIVRAQQRLYLQNKPLAAKRVIPLYWPGGSDWGKDVSNFDDNPNQFTISVAAGTKYSRSSEAALTYGAGIC